MTDAARGSRQRVALVEGWRICATAPGAISSPDQLGSLAPQAWTSAERVGTVASVLREAGTWSLDGPERRFDAEDWWYTLSFTPPDLAPGESLWLHFDGLATIAEVWLNGAPLFQSSNMFIAHDCDLSGRVQPGTHRLDICFRSLDAALAAKRPRPRWRAPMVPQQQLRWHRTTLLGRTPGWSPPAAAVGPVGEVWLERRGALRVDELRVHAQLDAEGAGVVQVQGVLPSPQARGARIDLEVEREGRVERATLSVDDRGQVRGTLRVEQPTLWWPHTHGDPSLYQARIVIHSSGNEPAHQALRRIGFRRVEVDHGDGRFAVSVNGVPVFCRGACWTPLDVVALRSEPEALQRAVAQARDAGMNMLRVGGTMVYEGDAFFEACDALGVLVWQEFMFANMDYPEHDETFMASVQAEAAQQLARWQAHPCVAVVCGNSEVEQQAAMWGAVPELWAPALFHTTLRRWVQDALPGVAYWPSSAHGGDFPHQPAAGTTSYYGVGAYLRPLDDARRAELSFATECLAFANVPDDATLARMPGGLGLRAHHPEWKRRTPRDLNAGWDFEDVRDHYLKLLHGVDPVALRSTDHERYLALSRVVTGEVMASAFAEWRRPGSRCGGAFVWFLRDLWAGAGWGLLDDQGRPKACQHALSRALQPQALFITDEGLNGLAAQVVNETNAPLQATLAVRLYGRGDAPVGAADHVLAIAPRGGACVGLGAGLASFTDLSYAYRFGPPPVLLVHASLIGADGRVMAEAFHFPAGRPSAVHDDIGLTARFDAEAEVLYLATTGFAQHVHIDCAGRLPADNDFHLAPGAARAVALPRGAGAASLHGTVWALNATRPVAFSVQP